MKGIILAGGHGTRRAPRMRFGKGLATIVAWYQDDPQWRKPIRRSGDRP